MTSKPLSSCLQPQAPIAESSSDYRLKFASDGTFQITVFSDLHFTEHDYDDVRTAKVVKKVLEHEHTELVVLNGDLMSGYSGVTDEEVPKHLDQLVAPIIEKSLPWASTYGNHDNQARLTSARIFDLETQKRKQNCLTQSMIQISSDAGITNYYLPVYPASGATDEPELILWFFDSRGGREPDFVHESVAKWFRNESSHLAEKYNKTIPSLAFFHIPGTATYRFDPDGKSVDPSKEPGVNGETVCWQGQAYDSSHIGYDEEFMQALWDTKGLLATFSGHDHQNDWCFKWKGPNATQDMEGDGISMCYDRHTGYGGYGYLARGGRQILLKQDSLKKEVVTWIRLEDGLVPENVTLNATYGQDEYHPLPRHQDLKRDVFESLGHQPSLEINSAILLLVLMIYLSQRLWG